MKTKSTSIFVAGFLVSLVLLAGVAWLNLRHAATVQDSARWVARSHEVRFELSELLSTLQDVETGERGYVLTGEPDFLAPYEAALKSERLHYLKLRRLTAGIPEQQTTLAAIEPLIMAKVGHSASVVRLRREEGAAAAQAEVASGRGKAAMEAVRAGIAKMDALEQRLLAEWSATTEIEVGAARDMTLLCSGFSFVVLIVVFGAVLRENRLRRQANARLGESEESLAVTLHSIGDGVLATDAAGRVTRLNAVAEALTGWSQAQAADRPVAEVFQLISEETRQPVLSPVADTLAKGTVHGLAKHAVLLARDGSERPIADSCAPIRDRTNRVIGVVLVFRDVTSERQAARKLAELRRHHELLFDSVADGLHELDINGMISFENPAAERMLGYARGELLGRPAHVTIHHHHADGAEYPVTACPIYATLRDGETRTVRDEVFWRKDGSCFPVEYVVSPISDEAGERIGVIVAFRDVTERKDHVLHLRRVNTELDQRVRERTAELELERAMLATAFAKMPMGVVLSDAQGGDIVMNAAAERMHGFASRDDMHARVDAYAAEWELRDAAGRVLPFAEWPLPRAIAGDFYHDLEIHLRNLKTGHEWDCSYTAAPVRDGAGVTNLIVLTLLDITQLSRTTAEIRALNASLERRIQESTAELDRFFTLSLDLLGVAHADGYFKRISPAFTQALGWSVEEMLARPFLDFIHEDDRTASLAVVEQLVARGENLLQFENRYAHKDGSWRVLSWKAVPQPGGLMYCAARDVTQQRLAERELRLREERFRALVTASARIIWRADAHGRPAEPSPEWRAFAGAVPGDFASDDWSRAIHPDDRARVLAEFARGIAGRQPFTIENRVRRHDGQYRAMSTFAAPVLGRDGAVREWIGALTDVTEKNEAEQELRVREERFRALATAGAQIIWLADAQGAVHGPVPAWQQLTGMTESEIQGQGWSRALHPDDLAGTAEQWSRAVAAREPMRLGYRVRRHDGEYRHCAVHAVPLCNPDGSVREWIGAIADVTEKHQAEQELRQAHDELRRANDELAQASRLKDEFLANMSHELRTPLNAILGLSEALLENPAGTLTPRQLKSLTTISTSGTHLLALINDILDLSKIEAGKLELNLDTVNVREFCESCLAFVRTQAMQKRIGVAFEADGRVPHFTADPKRFKQILVNLLTNAVKFTPEGGRIGLTVAAPEGEEALRFTVWDTGIGIAEADQGKLFRAFTQIDSGLTRAQEGTGLGLALVAKLVELHGGSVALVSAPGQGSRFVVSLPLISPGAAPALEPATAPDRRGFRRAVIIEDDPTAGEQLGQYLAEMGLSSVVHADGDHAVEAVRRERPDVVFLDIMLPGTSGWVVLGQLKEQPDTRDIPVVVLSVVDEPQRARALGAAAHFTKPVARAQLAGFLQRRLAPPPAEAFHRALLIEDDPTAGAILTGYLTELGLSSVVHARGEESVEAVLRERPDVILLDILLPGESGWVVLTRLKEHPGTRDIPVIVISVVDEPGKSLALGAVAHFTKPILREQLAGCLRRAALPRPLPVPRGGSRPAQARRSILLAEDNEANIQTIGGYLEDKGYEMHYAVNGLVAVKLARELRPELILMDIQMPVMDGLAAIREIRADVAMQKFPIVALTALAMPGDRERCVAAGATDYLSKPVKLKKLAALVEKLMAQAVESGK